MNIAVVMCTYRRPEKLHKTLTQLAAQRYKGFDLHIVNNNPEIADIVDAEAHNSVLHVDVQHNDENHGSYARIEKMVELRDRYDWFMTLDDDMVFGPGLLQGWVDQITPDVVYSFGGWRFIGNYWQRERVPVGEVAPYLWGGNMFLPSDAMRDDGVLDLHQDYWMCEDLWLSYYLDHVLGYYLIVGCADIRIEEDAKDTYYGIRNRKVILLDELRARGWDA